MQARTLSEAAQDLAGASVLTVEALARLDAGALQALFVAGSASDDLTSLSGHPRGRVLAAPALSARILAWALRRLASSPLILWEGKSFQAAPGAPRGRGANRARLGGRAAVFPFRTWVEGSVVDGRPCVVVSYDVPRNPRIIRPIYDELRLVAPDLYLGRGTYRRRGRAARVLVWFALDAGRQDAPLALPVTGD